MDKIFGIDLGTTLSEISYLKNGKPVVVTLENGRKYLPSVVGIDPSGKIITGFRAKNQYTAFPENTVVSVKRKMGSGQTLTMGGKSYTPAEISAEILKTLKSFAEKEAGLPVEKVVITVPAYFTDAQRKDTIKAGEIAGLEVVRIINEPTAAALAYGCREDGLEKILVYDLGGGTFDVSLIIVEEGVIEVLASDGNSQLGGDDFDRLLEEYFISYLPENAVSPKDLRLKARLENIAEAVKIQLSTETGIEVKEEFIASIKGKPINLDLSVSRSEFEGLIEEKLGATFKQVEQVIKEGKLKKEDITKILLVGGSTYIPRIFNTLSDDLNFDVHREVDPTYCVAMGAAIQGGIIAGEQIDTILIDVNSHSLGIRCLNIKPTGKVDYDHYSIIIHKNTTIPASMSRTYYTSVENQRAIEIEAFQGENPEASKNTFIGSFVMDKLSRKLPDGSAVDVAFEYNLNGNVEITAHERISGRKRKMKVDVNRLEKTADISGKEPTDNRPKKDGIDEKKIERIFKTAHKKLDQIDNPELLAKIKDIIDFLEKAIPENGQKTKQKAEELAELIAEI